MLELKPRIFNLFMKPFEERALNKRRAELIPSAKGNVLEIGAGTGVNFDYYNKDSLTKLTVLDLKFNNLIKSKPLNSNINIDYVIGSAEELPFPDETFDSVVSTLIYCSLDNPHKGLSEVYRVLKPGGKMYFIEHVLPHHKHYKSLANHLNGAWKKVGKCNINRDTLRNIENANFKVENYERFGNDCFVFIKGVGVKR